MIFQTFWTKHGTQIANQFASVIHYDEENNTKTNIVSVYRGYKKGTETTAYGSVFVVDDDNVWKQLSPRKEWHTYTYYINLTTGKFEIQMDNDETKKFGPYSIDNSNVSANALYFISDYNNVNADSGFYVDNIKVVPAFSDPVITFVDEDGETSLGTVTVKRGEIDGVVPTPTKDGYVFMGWENAEGSLVSDFSSITSDITLKAKYADKIITEDFENITKNVSEDGVVTLSTTSGFEFVLGSGAFNGKTGNTDIGSGINTAYASVDESKSLEIKQIRQADSVAIKFPAVTSGKFMVSFDGYANAASSALRNFASLANIEGESVKTLVDVRRETRKCVGETSNILGTCLLVNNTTQYRLAKRNEWHRYTYMVDIEGKKVDIAVDGEIKVQGYDLPADTTAVNALWFYQQTANEVTGSPEFRIDNLTVVRDYDAVTSDTDYKGAQITLAQNEVINIAKDVTLSNATIDATNGKVVMGTTEITGGTVVFNDKGEIDVADNSSIKLVQSKYNISWEENGETKNANSDNGTEAVGFMTRTDFEEGAAATKYIMNIEAIHSGTTKNGTVEIPTPGIYAGSVRLLFSFVNVPSDAVVNVTGGNFQ